jgi:hypothetical protein
MLTALFGKERFRVLGGYFTRTGYDRWMSPTNSAEEPEKKKAPPTKFEEHEKGRRQ